MARVRGYLYFENKNLNDVKEALWSFSIKGLDYKFFDKLIKLKKEINLPGVLLDGEVDVKDSKDYSREIIFLLRKKVGLEEKTVNCDVSSAVGKEDDIRHIKKGKLKGKYVAIRLLPDYPSPKKMKEVAADLGGMVNADDVLLRGVENIVYKDKEIPKRCIDLIGDIHFNTNKKAIENYLESKKLILEGYTLIDLL